MENSRLFNTMQEQLKKTEEKFAHVYLSTVPELPANLDGSLAYVKLWNCETGRKICSGDKILRESPFRVESCWRCNELFIDSLPSLERPRFMMTCDSDDDGFVLEPVEDVSVVSGTHPFISG
jgi:hypothetical protein